MIHGNDRLSNEMYDNNSFNSNININTNNFNNNDILGYKDRVNILTWRFYLFYL